MVAEPTGWYSYDEFVEVFHRLRAPEEYAWVVGRIALWKSRAKVPSAVTATDSLISAVVADRQGQLSDHGLRSLYAMALIRFVNLLLDHEQDREYARSLKLIAKACDLPEYIITVRHECTHREIPDLNTLRLAAFDAINYVYAKYWLAQYKTIMHKLDNPDYDATAMSSLLLCAYSTALTELSPACLDAHEVWLRYPSCRSFLRRRLMLLRSDSSLVSLVMGCKRFYSIALRRSRLSFRRKRRATLPCADDGSDKSAATTCLVRQVACIARRLIDGCAHDAFFVSAFVEFAMALFEPSEGSLFLVLLLECLAHLPFNFTLQVAGSVLSVVFDLPDGLSPGEAAEAATALRFQRVKKYSDFTATQGPAYIRQRLSSARSLPAFAGTPADRSCARRRMNRWLQLLLESAFHFEDRSKWHRLPLYAVVAGCSGRGEGYNLWANAGAALARFARAVHVLLPHAAARLRAHDTNKQEATGLGADAAAEPWERDRTSHALGLHAWLSRFSASKRGSRYAFQALSEAEKRERHEEIKRLCASKESEIDSLLLPGTLWDPRRWRVEHTVPQAQPSRVSHERISSAVERLSRRCPIRLSSRNNRRFERAGPRVARVSTVNIRDSRAFLHISAQLSVSLKQLCIRERYS